MPRVTAAGVPGRAIEAAAELTAIAMGTLRLVLT